MKHTVDVMISEQEVKTRIAELGRQITEHYRDSGSDMVLVGLLRGSFMFMAISAARSTCRTKSTYDGLQLRQRHVHHPRREDPR